MDVLNLVWDVARPALVGMLSYWWIWLPVMLAAVLYEMYASYTRAKHLAGLKWVVLDVVPPPEVLFSTAKAAENIFAGLHASYAGFPGTSWKSQFFQGKVPVWFSFEMTSDGGETHFYIRCPEDQRNVVESLIFAQYPSAEIRIAEDYVDQLPAKFDPQQFDVSGAELEFTKEPAYPIKTYEEFEEAGGKDEFARLDPIAPLMEVLSALQPGEHLWLQYVFRATGGDWAKEGQKVVDKLMGKEAKPDEKDLVSKYLGFIVSLLEGLISLFSPPAEVKKEEKKEERFSMSNLPPGKKQELEAVERKLSKLAFKTGIRLLYVAPKDSFNGSRIASVTAMFKQLYYTNLNTFKPGNSTRDKGMFKWIFPNDVGFFAAERTLEKKAAMYGAYRARTFPEKDGKELLVILNTEELATLWHLPGRNVLAPLMPRVPFKVGQPPLGLPTR